MTERDLQYDGDLDEALAFVERAVARIGGSLVLNDFSGDFRAGYLELDESAVAHVILLGGESGKTTIRVDVRTEGGQRLAEALQQDLEG
jgi:hypothetical protein